MALAQKGGDVSAKEFPHFCCHDLKSQRVACIALAQFLPDLWRGPEPLIFDDRSTLLPCQSGHLQDVYGRFPSHQEIQFGKPFATGQQQTTLVLTCAYPQEE